MVRIGYIYWLDLAKKIFLSNFYLERAIYLLNKSPNNSIIYLSIN